MKLNFEEKIVASLMIITVLFLLLTIITAILQPFQESATYNRLTGAHTTPWDAMWVELRVQGQINTQP